MTIEIVDFPIKHGRSFHSFLLVYQRVESDSLSPGEASDFRMMKLGGPELIDISRSSRDFFPRNHHELSWLNHNVYQWSHYVS